MLDCGRDPDRVKNAEADTYGLSMILGISEALSLIIRSTAICPHGTALSLNLFMLTSFLFDFVITTTQQVLSNESCKTFNLAQPPADSYQ